MFTTTFHVLLANAHEIEHRGGIIKLHINRKSLHEHSQRMSETTVSTSVIHGVEKRLLLTIEACQQQGVCRREERTLEDVVRTAEFLHLSQIKLQRLRPTHIALRLSFIVLRLHSRIQIRFQWRIGFTTIEVFRIPLLCLLILILLSQRGFVLRPVHQCHLLLGEGFSSVCSFHIVNPQVQGGTIVDDMVNIAEKIEMLLVVQQTDMEQAVAHHIERIAQLVLHRIDTVDFLQLQCPFLLVEVNRLQGLTLCIYLYASEEGWMVPDSGFHGLAQSFAIQTWV